MHWCMFSHVRLFVTPWTVTRQDPLSMGFSRQEHWSGLLFTPPGQLLTPRIKPVSLMSPTLRRQIPYQLCHLGNPLFKKKKKKKIKPFLSFSDFILHHYQAIEMEKKNKFIFKLIGSQNCRRWTTWISLFNTQRTMCYIPEL